MNSSKASQKKNSSSSGSSGENEKSKKVSETSQNSSHRSESEKSKKTITEQKSEEKSKKKEVTSASKSSKPNSAPSEEKKLSSNSSSEEKDSKLPEDSKQLSKEDKDSKHSSEEDPEHSSEKDNDPEQSEKDNDPEHSSEDDGKKSETNGKKEKNPDNGKDKQREKRDKPALSESYFNPLQSSTSDKPVRLSSVAALNSKGMVLTWRDIKYEVAQETSRKFCCFNKGEEEEVKYKQILKGITGQVVPGDLLAILGPSGAGKTTFLNILARRIKTTNNKKVQGTIELNGELASRTYFKKVSGFVSQEDILMGSMTPYEALMFTATLTLGNLSHQEKEDKVLNLLQSMGLMHVKDNFIGYVGPNGARSGIARGVSGGERKRVSICVELMHNPLLLFMDEPTSGLDSYAAKTVVSCLRNLADQGRTIVCTIHQPAVEIFRMFNKLLLLGSGNIVYFGPINDAMDYFNSIGHPLPKFYNPADHYLKVVQMGGKEVKDVEDGANLKDAVQEHTMLAESFQKSKYGKLVNNLLEKSTDKTMDMDDDKPTSSCCGGEEEPQTNNHRAPAYVQIGQLYKRSMNNVLREPILLKTRIFQTLFMSILSGLIFLQLPNSLTGAENKVSGGFFVAISPLFGALTAPIATFPPERAVYWRENGSGLYTVASYYFSKLAAEIPVNLLSPMIFATIAWWMIGFKNDAGSFFTFMLMQIILTTLGYGMGMVLVMCIYDPGVAQRVQPLVLLPLMLFAGFFINTNSVPVWLIWLAVLSPLKYAFRAVMNIVLSGIVIYCGPSDLRAVSYGVALLNSTTDPWITAIGNSTTDSVLVCPTTSGDQLLAQLGFGGFNIWIDIIIVVCYMVFFMGLSFILLACRKARF